MEGLLLFGKEHVYIVDGLTVLRSREVRDIESIPPQLQEPILPSPGPGSPTRPRSMRQSYKFHYEDIRLSFICVVLVESINFLLQCSWFSWPVLSFCLTKRGS